MKIHTIILAVAQSLSIPNLVAHMNHAKPFLPYSFSYTMNQQMNSIYSTGHWPYYGYYQPFTKSFADNHYSAQSSIVPKMTPRNLLMSHIFNKYKSDDYVRASTKICPRAMDLNEFNNPRNELSADCVTYFDSHLKLPADQGRRFCEKQGLKLASTRSKDENDILSSNAVNIFLDGRRTASASWIWQCDNTTIACPYWHAPYEPNNINKNENCILLTYYGAWKDVNCNHRCIHSVEIRD